MPCFDLLPAYECFVFVCLFSSKPLNTVVCECNYHLDLIQSDIWVRNYTLKHILQSQPVAYLLCLILDLPWLTPQCGLMLVV